MKQRDVTIKMFDFRVARYKMKGAGEFKILVYVYKIDL